MLKASQEQVSLAKRIIMLTAGVPASMCYTTLTPILPKMEAALAHNPMDQLLVKMVVGVNGVAMILAAPVAGFLADKLGRAPIMTWAILISAFAGSVGYFIVDLKLMIVSRLVLGMAAATAAIVGVTVIGDQPDVTMGRRYMGLQVSISALTAVLTVPLAGALADLYWRLPFLLFLGILPLGVIARVALGDVTPTPTVAAPINTGRIHIPIKLLVLSFVTGMGSIVAMTYIPFQLRDIGVSSATKIGLIVTCQPVTTAIFACAFGYARRHISSQTAFAISFILSSIGMVVISFAPVISVATYGIIILGVGMGWLAPNLMARAAEAGAPTTRGRVVGVVKGVHFFASFAAVLMLEPIFRFGGAKGALLALAGILSIAGFLCVSRIPEKRVLQ